MTIINSEDKVHYGSSSYWNSLPNLVGLSGNIYIYSDHKTDRFGNYLAAIKVGNGSSLLNELPFTDKLYEQHIENGVIHITEQERNKWNGKADCHIDSEDPNNLIITTNDDSSNQSLFGVLKKITFNGVTYYLEDEEARSLIEALGSPAHFRGETITELTNHATTNPIVIVIDGEEEEVTAVNGDIVAYLSQEFIFDGHWWIRLGDFSGLGALAYKNSVSVVTTASGTCTGANVTLNTETIGTMANTGTAPSIVDEEPQDTTKPQPVKFSISGTKLTITMGTFNAGSMPTRTTKEVATGVETITQPTFTGNAVSGEVTYG